MDEKVLFTYNVSEDPMFKKTKLVCLITTVIMCVYAGFPIAVGGNSDLATPMIVLAIFVIALVWGAYIFSKKQSITISSTRVSGRTMFAEVSLPIDALTMTSKKGKQKLQIESSSENVVFGFLNIQSRNEAYDVINRLIAERSNNKGNVTVVNNASNADELAKYKQLLDTGVITQEEFDAKKKQLLGL